MKSKESFQDRIINLQDNLLSFAYQLTTNREQAQDLLQDTTLKALDNEDKYVDNVNFKGWIFTIMRNIFINNYRQSVRKATVIDQTEDLYHLNICQDSGLTTPEGSYAVKEISMALNSFSEDYRIPFNMFVSGYKYNEIAKKLNLPLGTVKSRIFFARKRLREQQWLSRGKKIKLLRFRLPADGELLEPREDDIEKDDYRAIPRPSILPMPEN